MKANNLQVGDFVLIQGVPRKIEQITKKKVGYHLSKNECRMHYERYCKLKPIKMSYYIAKKLGFNNVDKRFYFNYELILNGFTIELSEMSNSLNRDFYVHIDNRDCESIGGCDIEYLHQLQQIVRLTASLELNITEKLFLN